MTYRLDITLTVNESIPNWWRNYLTENNLQTGAAAKLWKHLLDNYNCQYYQSNLALYLFNSADARWQHRSGIRPDNYEHYLEFADDADRVMFLLRWA